MHVEAGRGQLQREREDGGQVGAPVSRAGPERVEGSQFATGQLTSTNSFFLIGKGFCSSCAALERLANRQRTSLESRHDQSSATSGGNELAAQARSSAASGALRTQASGRTDPLRYQAPGAHRQARSPYPRRPQ